LTYSAFLFSGISLCGFLRGVGVHLNAFISPKSNFAVSNYRQGRFVVGRIQVVKFCIQTVERLSRLVYETSRELDELQPHNAPVAAPEN
jgi:hypothetical protein